MANEKHPLQQLIEDTCRDTRSYSGRGMYGKECLGVVLDDSNVGQLVADLVDAAVENGLDDPEPVVTGLRSWASDRMGHGTIIYFPGVPYSDPGEEDNG